MYVLYSDITVRPRCAEQIIIFRQSLFFCEFVFVFISVFMFSVTDLNGLTVIRTVAHHLRCSESDLVHRNDLRIF